MPSSYALANIDQFKSVLNSQTVRAQIKNCLKDNASSFMSSMLDLYMNDRNLQSYDPNTVIAECLKAASLKLPIVKSLGFAYIVPYKNKPTFTIGYKGLIQLAQRTGLYKYINADVVYEGELRGFDKLSGMLDLSGEKLSDTITGYFAYIKLNTGFEKVFYMTVEEVTQYAAKYSPSYHSASTPWKTEFNKMALKTVLRQLISRYGALTVEMSNALEVDDKGSTPQQEIKNNANKGEPIDVDNTAHANTGSTNKNEASAESSQQPDNNQDNSLTDEKTQPVQQSLSDPGF